MARSIIAIGSNQGDRFKNLKFAFEKIENLPNSKTISNSKIYETVAIGGPEQNDYLNAVVLIETQLVPFSLLLELQNIENAAGRTREITWGPRTLDLDIIDIEDFKSETNDLQIPHPRATERKFVLQPILDVDENWKLEGKSIRSWLINVQSQQVSIWEG